MKELVIDAFPDFLDEYEVLTPLVQSVFHIVREETSSKH